MREGECLFLRSVRTKKWARLEESKFRSWFLHFLTTTSTVERLETGSYTRILPSRWSDMQTIDPRVLKSGRSDFGDQPQEDGKGSGDGADEEEEEEEDQDKVYDVGESQRPDSEPRRRHRRGGSAVESIAQLLLESLASSRSNRAERILDYVCARPEGQATYEVMYLVKWVGYDDP